IYSHAARKSEWEPYDLHVDDQQGRCDDPAHDTAAEIGDDWLSRAAAPHGRPNEGPEQEHSDNGVFGEDPALERRDHYGEHQRPNAETGDAHGIAPRLARIPGPAERTTAPVQKKGSELF